MNRTYDVIVGSGLDPAGAPPPDPGSRIYSSGSSSSSASGGLRIASICFRSTGRASEARSSKASRSCLTASSLSATLIGPASCCGLRMNLLGILQQQVSEALAGSGSREPVAIEPERLQTSSGSVQIWPWDVMASFGDTNDPGHAWFDVMGTKGPFAEASRRKHADPELVRRRVDLEVLEAGDRLLEYVTLSWAPPIGKPRGMISRWDTGPGAGRAGPGSRDRALLVRHQPVKPPPPPPRSLPPKRRRLRGESGSNRIGPVNVRGIDPRAAAPWAPEAAAAASRCPRVG